MGDYPRQIACQDEDCEGVASIVIIHAPMFSMEFEDRAGFNVGAGEYFANRHERKEWLKRSERVETDPRTGMERVVKQREVMPEEVWSEKAYLKDVAQAQADGAPPPQHPDIAKKRAIETTMLKERLKKARPAAVKELIRQELVTP